MFSPIRINWNALLVSNKGNFEYQFANWDHRKFILLGPWKSEDYKSFIINIKIHGQHGISLQNLPPTTEIEKAN